jgi:hypothetical protein
LGPERIATTPQQALSRLLLLPGPHYSEPECSWKYVLAPGGLGFMDGKGLGSKFRDDMFLGFAVSLPLGVRCSTCRSRAIDEASP